MMESHIGMHSGHGMPHAMALWPLATLRMVCRDWLGHVVAGLQLTIGLRAGYDASRQRLVGLAVTWTPYNPMTPLCMCIVFRLTAQGRGVSTSITLQQRAIA